MVDERVNNIEEKDKRYEKKIPTDHMQWNIEGE
jgi:hypothetical protein